MVPRSNTGRELTYDSLDSEPSRLSQSLSNVTTPALTHARASAGYSEQSERASILNPLTPATFPGPSNLSFAQNKRPSPANITERVIRELTYDSIASHLDRESVENQDTSPERGNMFLGSPFVFRSAPPQRTDASLPPPALQPSTSHQYTAYRTLFQAPRQAPNVTEFLLATNIEHNSTSSSPVQSPSDGLSVISEEDETNCLDDLSDQQRQGSASQGPLTYTTNNFSWRINQLAREGPDDLETFVDVESLDEGTHLTRGTWSPVEVRSFVEENDEDVDVVGSDSASEDRKELAVPLDLWSGGGISPAGHNQASDEQFLFASTPSPPFTPKNAKRRRLTMTVELPTWDTVKRKAVKLRHQARRCFTSALTAHSAFRSEHLNKAATSLQTLSLVQHETKESPTEIKSDLSLSPELHATQAQDTFSSDLAQSLTREPLAMRKGSLHNVASSASPELSHSSVDGEVRQEPSDGEAEPWVMRSPPLHEDRLGTLKNCMEGWAVGINWIEHTPSNPLWTLKHDVLLGSEAMDLTTSYLVYQANLSSKASNKPVCLFPASVFGAVSLGKDWAEGLQSWLQNVGPGESEQLFRLRDMVWLGSTPPARVIIPVIDPLHIHCYLWYGDVKRRAGESVYDCHLSYLDSLDPTSNLVKQRLSTAQRVLNIILPQINGNITGSLRRIPGYRQLPGSLDCGIFACQAASALASYDDKALENLRPVALVRDNMRSILQECLEGALLRLRQGYYQRDAILLHRDSRISPPPWRVTPTVELHKAKPKAAPWVPPRYTRSLSEPLAPDISGNPDFVGWKAAFGPTLPAEFVECSPDDSFEFLSDSDESGYRPPAGILAGVASNCPPDTLLEAVLLKDTEKPTRWLPNGIHVVGGQDEHVLENADECMGVARMGANLLQIREGRERSLAVLTGENLGHPLRLNWAADSIEPEEAFLSASLDIDSLSVTCSDPQFLLPAVVHAYPPRSSTLTTDNGLRFMHEGEHIPLSHCPNFTLLHIGLNNQFRGNLIFPNMERRKDNGGRFITFVETIYLKMWWEKVMWQAILRVAAVGPPELADTCRRLLQELPPTYATAQDRAVQGTRSFAGHKVTPEILNIILRFARRIVDSDIRLAVFRGFFFHIYGMNLKAVAEAIPQRGNPVIHALKLFPFLNWSRQNPHDIVLDAGLEINVRRDQLPDHIEDLTLLWKLDALKQLMGAWRQPTTDAYCHSHVVGGVSAWPRVYIAILFFFMHAYMKDKTATYVHRDNSIGAGFSPMDGLLGDTAYVRETSRTKRAWADNKKSFGARLEFRCTVEAAAQILRIPPDLWMKRFLGAGALVAIPTFAVVRWKVVMLDAYMWFFEQMQRLSQLERSSDGVQLLASVLTYFMHGLVKRPDDMSSSRSMAKALQLVPRAIRFGLPSVPRAQLGVDLVRLEGDITQESYPILKYVSRKNPAGARLKTSLLATSASNPPAHDQDEGETAISDWTSEDQGWVNHLVNVTLAQWLWTRLPEAYRSKDASPRSYSGPWRIAPLARLLEGGITLDRRTQGGGFRKVVDMLFPPNWSLVVNNRQWVSLQWTVLDPIRNRIYDQPVRVQKLYGVRMRSTIYHLVGEWEFLPATQKARVWSYDGTGRTRRYKVHINPLYRQ